MKKFIVVCSIVFIVTFVSFANEPNDSLSKFMDTTSEIIQENTLALNTTADAFIGKIYPAIPPHFHFGLSIGTTFMNTSHLDNAFKAVVKSDPNSRTAEFPVAIEIIPMPTYSFNFRIGGFYLPFDTGVFISFSIPPQGIEFPSQGYSQTEPEYFHDVYLKAKMIKAGIDLRYAILEGTKVLPKISIGGGYIYSYDNFTFGAKNGEKTTTVSLDMNTQTLYAQMQISKRFSFVLPYVGARAFFTRTENKYSYKIKDDKTNEIPYINVDFSPEKVQAQVFAGIGFMLPSSQITINGSYNPMRNLWTASIHGGFRM